MMKSVVLLISLLYLLQSATSCKRSTTPPIEPPTSTPETPISTIYKTNITDTNYTPAQKDKLVKASEIIVKVYNSPEFKEAILNHEFEGKKSFDSNNGMSNEQIYEAIMAAEEGLVKGKNYQMDLTLTMYLKRLSKVVGYTYPTSNIVFTNYKFHNTYTPSQVAANLAHEHCHKLGFNHKSTKSDKSVPYAIGNLVKILSLKYL